jgi:D-threo-aldose 1-dehydrogenase
VPFDPFERVTIGRTSLGVTRLGLGGAPIGGLFGSVATADAVALVEHAWAIGIRSFDVAPLYGYGAAERRMGRVLADRPRDDFVLSTKVGRVIRRAWSIDPDDDVDRQGDEGRDDAFYAATAGRRVVFDYSADGVLRSVEASLDRLGLDRIDILYIHDPDDHWQEVLDGAYPALDRLRAAGVVGAIGAGMNQSAMLTRFVTETDIDVVLVAGRYTLLDQSAAIDLLPACVERGVGVIAGGVMNSGILADPDGGGRYDYRAAPAAIIGRARLLADVCRRHDVPLTTAAIQFPLGHPAMTGLVAGVRTASHLDQYPAAMRTAIPLALWDELRAEGLLAADVPTPA